jgi:hypothetical protein
VAPRDGADPQPASLAPPITQAAYVSRVDIGGLVLTQPNPSGRAFDAFSPRRGGSLSLVEPDNL